MNKQFPNYKPLIKSFKSLDSYIYKYNYEDSENSF